MYFFLLEKKDGPHHQPWSRDYSRPDFDGPLQPCYIAYGLNPQLPTVKSAQFCGAKLGSIWAGRTFGGPISPYCPHGKIRFPIFFGRQNLDFFTRIQSLTHVQVGPTKKKRRQSVQARPHMIVYGQVVNPIDRNELNRRDQTGKLIWHWLIIPARDMMINLGFLHLLDCFSGPGDTFWSGPISVISS